MITPPPLQKDDIIALATPARSIGMASIKSVRDLFEQQGWQLRLDPRVFSTHHQFGGNDQQRKDHLNALIADPAVKAILCGRGGYGSLRIVDELDLKPLASYPKWLIGFSDITVLHASFQKHAGIESIHATMPFNMHENSHESLESLLSVLQGNAPSYTFEWDVNNRAGNCEGKLTGGNLSILYSLQASASMPDPEGCILLIEDVDEYLYHIDRMMLSLRRSGFLSRLAGVVAGNFTQIHDNNVPFGCSVQDIIREHTDNYRYPVAFGLPAGHLADNRALILGRQTSLHVKNRQSSSLIQNTNQ